HGGGAPRAAPELPPRVPSSLGRQVVLHAAAARPAARGCRRRPAASAARARCGAGASRRHAARAHGRQPALSRGKRPRPGRDRSAAGQARRLPARSARAGGGSPGQRAGRARGADRPARAERQATAPVRGRHRLRTLPARLGEDWTRAARYARLAADRAAALCADAESVALYERALEALGRLPDTKETARAGIDVRLALRAPLWRAGRLDRLAPVFGDVE